MIKQIDFQRTDKTFIHNIIQYYVDRRNIFFLFSEMKLINL